MKKIFTFLAGSLLALGICTNSGSAQTTPKVVNGGVVNGKAVSLPKPAYPQTPRESGIEATIAVNITIDETGKVIAAEAELTDQRVRRAEDGNVLEPAVADPQLREAAEAAAREAKFSPTILDGNPVSVKGKLVYNFVSKSAPDTIGGNPKIINGGVLNGKTTSMPKPEYPAAAKAVRAEGSVSVRVTVDEAGNVTEATAVSGHPLLRVAAEAAAMQAIFSPTRLSGQPIRVTGILTYNFVL